MNGGHAFPQGVLRLSYPREIHFGPGTLAALPEVLPPGPRRILLATSASAGRLGLLNRLTKLLVGHDLALVANLPAEPSTEAAERLVVRGREHRADTVIAVGGGSVIDPAKLAAAVIPRAGTAADYFHQRRSLSGRGLFCAALPTTAGSGAELTPNSVLTDPDSGHKRSIRHSALIPEVALVDPELTLTAPPALTAASGLDALTQAIESCTAPTANAFTRPLAIAATATIFRHLETACRQGDDLAARTRLAEGSLLAAMSFAHTGLGAVHGLAHPLGAILHLPHGQVCAVLLPRILEWNAPCCDETYRALAQSCACPAVPVWIAAIRELAGRLGIPANFATAGLRPEHFPFIIRNCRSGSMNANPRPMTDTEVLQLLQALAAPAASPFPESP